MSQTKQERDTETAVLVKYAASELETLMERFYVAIGEGVESPERWEMENRMATLRRKADRLMESTRGREETARER